MNEKDKEAFNKYICTHDQGILQHSDDTDIDVAERAWQSACLHKQKEIDAIMSENQLCERFITQIQADKFEMRGAIEKLEAENAKLRECVEFYAQPWERGELDGELLVREIGSYDHFVEVHSIAKKVLKELEK